ncbi:unnamed protein product, partial [Mesorhabditis belari]|uniref:Cytochrome P450 n=1 Tax=Mesorhabditis belari TaxID=2138241 RepID=A0AAF3EPV3_9BILA
MNPRLTSICHEPDNGYYSMLQLENLVFDLWTAGMETTSNTLTWGIAYILNNKEVQKRIHSELDSVIKSDRLITLADKNHLPYLNATINEIQRMANLLPTNLFRKTTEEVQVMGYKIPKGTIVIPQISVVLFDEKLFPSPLSFKPERFLNDDGSLKKFARRSTWIRFDCSPQNNVVYRLMSTRVFIILETFITIPKASESGSASATSFPNALTKSRWDSATVLPSPFPTVIIADYETIKETIIKDGEKYTDRFTTEVTHQIRGGDFGILETSGDNWREMRRFTLHTLRDFGMGKNLMEEKVMSEVTSLMDRFTLLKETAPQWEFDVAVGSIINNLLFGYRYEEDKQAEFRELKNLLNDHMKNVATFSAGMAFTQPWTRIIPMFNDAWNKVLNVRNRLFEYFQQQIENRKKTIDYESETNIDLVEAFLKEQKKHRDEPDNGYYSMLQLENLVFDLWIAGMETTSNTLTWGIAYILNNKEVQKRIHSELDSVIKSDRLITLADKNHLPYLNATINEIQRMANLLPTNLFRKTTEEVQVMGYKIPKGTIVIPQISVVLFDEKLFPSPLSFKPERFLNDDGSLKKRFEISGDETPSIKKTAGFTMVCSPYKCQFKERR